MFYERYTTINMTHAGVEVYQCKWLYRQLLLNFDYVNKTTDIASTY